MPYQIAYRPAARRNLEKMDHPIRRRIVRSIEKLAIHPRPSGIKTWTEGSDRLYRVRVGDYRIVYAVRDEVLLVLIVRIRHRREVYRKS